MLALQLCLAAAGLTVPGYLLARAFRVGPAWAAAFPFSALMLVETVQLFAMTGVAIRFETMLMALGGYALCSLAWLRARSPDGSAEEDLKLSCAALREPLPAAALCLSLAILCVVVVRTALYPLRGPDTAFRWEGLAVAMLQHQSLAFYPPVTAADYAVYLYADGIPPLVASVY